MLPLSLVEYCSCNPLLVSLVHVFAKPSLVHVFAKPSFVHVFTHCWIFNKLHLGSFQLAFSGLIVTEYSTTTMNPAACLLRLRQGNRAIEDYVADFCKLCYQVDFNDTALKDIFRFGLTK